MKLIVRKWGNGAGVFLQRALLDEIDCDIGQSLEVVVDNGSLVLRPDRDAEFTLNDLLSTCTPSKMRLCREDRAWLDAAPVGGEL